jgi:membrane protein DedA with SNARE-associated domain
MNEFLHELIPFINQYGLIVIFFGMMVEGTTMIIATGILCYLGMIDLKYALPTAYIGALIGDQIWYFIGRRYAFIVIDRFRKFKQKIKELEPLVKNRGALLSFSGRFVYGGAIVFPLALGFYKYKYKKFLLFDSLGVALWSFLGIMIGYLLGTSAQTFIGKFERVWHIVVAVLVATFIIILIKKYFTKGKS